MFKLLQLGTVGNHVLLQLHAEVDIRAEALETVQHNGRIENFLWVRNVTGFPVPRLERVQPLPLHNIKILESKPPNGLR